MQGGAIGDETKTKTETSERFSHQGKSDLEKERKKRWRNPYTIALHDQMRENQKKNGQKARSGWGRG